LGGTQSPSLYNLTQNKENTEEKKWDISSTVSLGKKNAK
jgi:hypothetical protein